MVQDSYTPPRLLASKRHRRRPLISLTPLIDVVFILLVFFMLASSFLDWRTIDLSTPAQAGFRNSMEGSLLVEVRAEGLRLSGEPVTWEEFSEQITLRLKGSPEARVLLKPAAGVVLQDTIEVLDLLTGLGVADLSLIRDPE